MVIRQKPTNRFGEFLLTFVLVEVFESWSDSVRISANEDLLRLCVEKAEVEDSVQLRSHEVDSPSVVQMD